jgi:hypothetical protein
VLFEVQLWWLFFMWLWRDLDVNVNVDEWLRMRRGDKE